MRKKLLLGNWKMNKTVAEAKEFASASVSLVALAKEHNIDIGVAPTFLALDIVAKTNPNIIVAAQNVHFKESGAYTGEISIPMLKEIGIKTVIIGHSERRMYDNETSAKCNMKILKLVAEDMIAVYCVGETLDEFLNNKTSDVVIEQLKVGLNGVSPADLTKVIIAYEPVWSIGTGKAASKEIAENVCALIRSTIADLYNKEEADGVRILYGGSVKPNNVKEYMSEKDIDGALVGGASLAIDSYKELIEGM
ncbi:MAG: triose-phosphate isomerase [Bacilli bacterium]